MNKKQYSLMIVLALVAGLVGGVVSSQFLAGQLMSGESAFVEKRARPPKVIEAEEFRLVDNKGVLLAKLGKQEEFVIEIKKDGSREKHSSGYAHKLVFFGDEGREAVSLGTSSGKISALSIYSHIKGQPSNIQLGMDAGGSASLWLAGEPRLFLLNEGFSLESKPSGRFNLTFVDGEPTLEMIDKNSRSRIVLGVVELLNSKTGVTEKHPLSSLVLFNEKGNVIWKAP